MALDLRNQFTRYMEKNYIKECFLPSNMRDTLLTPEFIKPCLPNASTELQNFVCEKATNIFATLVFIRVETELEGVLQRCKDLAFTNDKLPVTESDFYLDVFRENDIADREEFYEKQQRFLSPKLSYNVGEIQRFHAGTVLPFLKRSGSGKGHFGDVQEASLHSFHLKEGPTDEQFPPSVAIKEFTSGRDDKRFTARAAWTAEFQAQKNIIPHGHLVKFIAAIERGDKYYLISEWANGGDLKTFWETETHPRPNADLIREVVTQLRGLAEALQSLHKPMNVGSSMPSRAGSTVEPTILSSPISTEFHPAPLVTGSVTYSTIPEIEVTDANGLGNVNEELSTTSDASNWRHGDLKPANILLFKNGSTLGHLKIGDLGLAKKHPKGTVLRHSGSNQWYGTQAYEPPEAMTRRTQPRSRRYDIWSFGCITLEMIIWLLYGYDGLSQFYNTPINDTTQTLYYTVDNGTAKVNHSLQQVMNAILEHDPECNGIRGESAIRSLLLLVRDKLLVVALPETLEALAGNVRIDSDELLKELTNILEPKPTGEAPYMWTGRARDAHATTFQYIMSRSSAPSGLGVSHVQSTLGRPQSRSTKRRRQTYRQDPLDIWNYDLDNKFATAVLKTAYGPKLHSSAPVDPICRGCFNLVDKLQVFTIAITNLQALPSQCNICKSLLIKSSAKSSTQQIRAVREDGLGIVFELGDESRQAWSIRQLPDVGSVGLHPGIQVSYPCLFEVGSDAYAELLRQWLHDCDNNHGDCQHTAKRRPPPTRLLHIGSQNDAQVQLVETSELALPGGEIPKFVALSYPWGQRSKIDLHLKTTVGNYENHKRGEWSTPWPELLQQAVRVTRSIGIEYLWIDALCIKQGRGGDFHEEAKRMEDVFSGAYCVLAASSAAGVGDGFLEEHKSRAFVRIPETSLFLCEDIDDFQGDVVEGHLNTRGWVLQERALARRTIHFTRKQTYFECGQGVRCETFTKMWNKQAGFLGDSDFPEKSKGETRGDKIRLYESLFEQYSRLQFSHAQDRPIAIAGLERRLCSAFETHGRFGVFSKFFKYGILWQRAGASLDRIEFSKDQERVPTWSWMAYEGAIRYLPDGDLPLGGVELADDVHWILESSNNSDGDQSNAQLHVTPRSFRFASGPKRPAQSGIVWDREEVAEGTAKCAVIGKLQKMNGLDTQRCYVLALQLTDVPNTYERVGSGWLAKNQIDFREAQSRGIVC